MSRPEPTPGLVVRYDYLWFSENARGHVEGAKERPCVVVLAREMVAKGQYTVLLAAITHSEPDDAASRIELPPAVRKHLGLDSQRQWIVLSEANIADWSDAGFVPTSDGEWAYGFLPPRMTTQAAESMSARFRRRTLPVVERGKPFKPRPA